MKKSLTDILKRTKILDEKDTRPNFYCKDLLDYCIYEMTGTRIKNCYECDFIKKSDIK